MYLQSLFSHGSVSVSFHLSVLLIPRNISPPNSCRKLLLLYKNVCICVLIFSLLLFHQWVSTLILLTTGLCDGDILYYANSRLSPFLENCPLQPLKKLPSFFHLLQLCLYLFTYLFIWLFLCLIFWFFFLFFLPKVENLWKTVVSSTPMTHQTVLFLYPSTNF